MNPNEVSAYLDQLPAEEKRVLEDLRQQIFDIAPNMVERLSRGVPFFYYLGKRAVGFRTSKTHLSFFIMEGEVLKKLHQEFQDYDHGSTVIRFDVKKPLPANLVTKLVLARLAEIEAKFNH